MGAHVFGEYDETYCRRSERKEEHVLFLPETVGAQT